MNQMIRSTSTLILLYPNAVNVVYAGAALAARDCERRRCRVARTACPRSVAARRAAATTAAIGGRVTAATSDEDEAVGAATARFSEGRLIVETCATLP